jgi:hypothetical protein
MGVVAAEYAWPADGAAVSGRVAAEVAEVEASGQVDGAVHEKKRDRRPVTGDR